MDKQQARWEKFQKGYDAADHEEKDEEDEDDVQTEVQEQVGAEEVGGLQGMQDC